jgi:hypothetical protein
MLSNEAIRVSAAVIVVGSTASSSIPNPTSNRHFIFPFVVLKAFKFLVQHDKRREKNLTETRVWGDETFFFVVIKRAKLSASKQEPKPERGRKGRKPAD